MTLPPTTHRAPSPQRKECRTVPPCIPSGPSIATLRGMLPGSERAIIWAMEQRQKEGV